MIIHLIKSINWVDVGLLVFFVRVILAGVQNGFVFEFFKLLGAVSAVFLSFHYYSVLAAWVAKGTGISWDYWDLVIFASLWFAMSFLFAFFRDGFLMLFKIETNHQGFDKYAAGLLAVGRGILVCSLTIFTLLLVHNASMTRVTLHSYSYKIAGDAGINTYSFLYKNLVSKFCEGEHYNSAAALVLHPVGK